MPRLGSSQSVLILAVGALFGSIAWRIATAPCPNAPQGSQPPRCLQTTSKTEATAMLQRQPGCFVPNLGQWDHPARFVHRSGPMTLFLEDRGWVLDLVERPARPKARAHKPGLLAGDKEADQVRGVAVRMTFEGDTRLPKIVGEKELPGHHNYFLGKEESCWRTGVPLYGSVRYENLYPRIDLRLHELNGVLEYDLLLEPGADLSLVTVHVEGAEALGIAGDGSLVIETAVGAPLTQSVPRTWQVGPDGKKRDVQCKFCLLGGDRFGFEASGWSGDTSLTIDPGLIWSTYLGARGGDTGYALDVDAGGVVTVTGVTETGDFPTTSGAYDTTHNGGGGGGDVFVTRLDPNKTGSAQLVYSTFLGGSNNDYGYALSIDAGGVVTVAGFAGRNFPTTSGAYDAVSPGLIGSKAFVSRLDPSRTGSAQLVYSTFLGGRDPETAWALSVDADGVVTLGGHTRSFDFPTTTGGYDTTFNGNDDLFVSRLDPRKTGSAQLVYSTFLGTRDRDFGYTLDVGAGGVVTVAGYTESSSFPTTSGAYDTTFNGSWDAFVSRLDPSKIGSAQLVYSTFLGGSGVDYAYTLSDNGRGVVTVAGYNESTDFPTTSDAYDTTHNGSREAFISRLDPSKIGSAQLVYSTFLGGSGLDQVNALSVDTGGVVTVAGETNSKNFPTTSNAYDRTCNGSCSGEAFVSRLDPSKSGSAQLVYSSLLGGSGRDLAWALSVDSSGVVTVAGEVSSTDYPTTTGAYDTTNNGRHDVFIGRLDMGVLLYGDQHAISISKGGTQKLTLNAGPAHANRSYWVFGSVTGTTPGVTLGSLTGPLNVPLNPDVWTDYTIVFPNTSILGNTKAELDASGRAQAFFNVPKRNLPSAIGLVFSHAYLVYGKSDCFTASNAVPLKLVK